MLLLAIANSVGLRSASWSAPLFWAALCMLVLPTALRIVWPTTGRSERLGLLLAFGVACYLAKYLHSPTSMGHFDEFLHWASTRSIMESHRLFLTNSMLPISPLYPGLEILTSAVAGMTGLPVFVASVVILMTLKLLLVIALFHLYERVGGSHWLAAVACIAYSANPGFIFFDSLFAYESLALVLFVFGLLTILVFEDQSTGRATGLGLVLLFFAALAVTHHMSAYFAGGFLALAAALACLGPRSAGERLWLVLFATIAVLLPLGWSWLQGNPSSGYLGPVLTKGAQEVRSLLGGVSKKLFVMESGVAVPLPLRIISVVSLLLTAIGLSTGFLRSLAMSVRPDTGWSALRGALRGQWTNRWMVLLSLIALGLPVSIAFRLTSSGWEIGSRMTPFVYVGVGFVFSVSVVRFWFRMDRRWTSTLGAGIVLAVLFMGGAITGWGPPATRIPYIPNADSLSLEPMGINAGLWTRDWLGEDRNFAADRVNRLILSGYGHQFIVNTLFDNIDVAPLFWEPTLTRHGLEVIRKGRLDYILSDLRITTALPLTGPIYERGEFPEGKPTTPEPSAMLKYDAIPTVNRVFDNGSIIIYDVRRLRDGR